MSAGAAAAVAAFFGRSAGAFATGDEVAAAIAEFAGAAVADEAALLTLYLPEIAENGHSVPLSVSVDSPMSDADHVTSVMILAPGNPNLEVATFHFTPASGVAAIKTRMRLERTQAVVALARTSTGTFHRADRHVEVTIGGCSV